MISAFTNSYNPGMIGTKLSMTPFMSGLRGCRFPQNYCSKVTSRPNVPAIQAQLDPGMFTSACIVGACLWLVVEGLESRPRGWLAENIVEKLDVRESGVEGAGIGLFVRTDLTRGTVLGSYPGRKWAQSLWLNCKARGNKEAQQRARTYTWLLDNGDVIDPTNNDGILEESVPWILPGGIRIPGQTLPTLLPRINEPPRGLDTNVASEEVDGDIVFVLERDIQGGEELFMDYGPLYERHGYSTASLGTLTFPSD